MTAQDLVPWFQMASTVLTGVGIIVSVSLGIASLNNNKRDRLLKIRPDLQFNIGGQEMSASIVPFEGFPGKAPDDPEVQAFMKALPAGANCLVLDDGFGQLFNLGQGTAFNASIWFEPQRITSGGQERWLKRSEQVVAPYTKAWNTIPATPANLPASASASFHILPGSVLAAPTDVTVVSGRMRIECLDAERNAAQWTQDATFFIDRRNTDKATHTGPATAADQAAIADRSAAAAQQTGPQEAIVTVSFEPRS
jgi:hypothetical protein